MRQALQALTDELRRLKSSGVKTVAVSDESVAALRRIVAMRASVAPAAERAVVAPSVASRAATPAPAQPASVLQKPVSSAERPAPAAPKSALPPGVAPIPSAAPVVTLPAGDKATRWAALRELVTNDAICSAHVRPGKKIVLGVGTLDAKIMFVGEAPGAEEEVQGEPFVGPAGQLLTKMIQAMGLKREEVYIGNIMNWRPEMPVVGGGQQVGNRPPTEEEMRYCLPYLRAQIEVVNPQLLVALGATAAQGLLGFGSFRALGDVRGRWHEFSGKPLMVTYHPSYILRNQSNRSKRMIWEDLLKVMERAELPISDRQRSFFLDK
jgi:uracil-DNA glycosylase family 4